MRMQIYSALGSLAMGCEILTEEKVRIDAVCGHGGFFKTPVVGQRAMSAAVGAPVTVLQNAGEGGAWGIAVLALLTARQSRDLEGLLDELFAESPKTTVSADENEIKAFSVFMDAYRRGLPVERLAAEVW
jgi:sugar (pentulose or hexulose) kinase